MALLNKDKIENFILVTARIVTQSDNHNYTVIRRCFVPRNKPVFTDLVEVMEKLFGNGIKFSSASFYYLGSNGEHVAFSSDDELAIAFCLTDKELKIGMEEIHTGDGSVLKVENPSSDSSAIITSLDSSPSTPTQYSRQRSNRSRSHQTGAMASSNNTPTLYRSKILPKIKTHWSFDHPRIKNTTFIKREPNLSRVGTKNKRININKIGYRKHDADAKCCGDCCHNVKHCNASSFEIDDEDEVGEHPGSCFVDYEERCSKRMRVVKIVGNVLESMCMWLYSL